MSNEITDDQIAKVLIGAPDWISVERMRSVLTKFQPYYKETLTANDALEILINMGNLFRLLKSAPEKPTT